MTSTRDFLAEKPLVSVIVPTFGRASFISKCIDSVLNQTYQNIELIVVDDNGEGTPNQLETAKKLAPYSSVRYIIHKNNQNGSAARNTGIRASNGQYLCFLDDDDVFMPTKIEKQLEAISGYGFCLCSIEKKSEEKAYSVINDIKGNLLKDVLLYKYDFCSGSSLMVARNIAVAVGGFDISLKRFQDYNFLAKISAIIKGISIPEVLVTIRLHTENSDYKITCKQYEKLTLSYLKSVKDILDKIDRQTRIEVENINYFNVIKQSVRKHNPLYFIKYAFLYHGKIELLKSIISTAKRVI